MLLDAGGNTHNFDRHKLHEPPRKLQDKCCDITTDGIYFYCRHLIDQDNFQTRLVEPVKDFSVRNLKQFDWDQIVTMSIPKFVPENENWLMSDDPKEFLQGIQKATGKNLRE